MRKINPFKKIINGVVDDNIYKRIGWLYVSFFLIFISVTILSYFLLPDAFLRGKHPIVSKLEFSPTLWISTLQIFGYNLIPTSLIIGANLIAQKYRISKGKFVPLGYTAFWGILILCALYLGTWSFEIVTEAPSLYFRFIRIFDVFNRSGFFELSAYLLAAAVSFKFTLWYSDGKKIIKSKKWKDIRLTVSEIIIFILVFVLLFCSASIESQSILSHTSANKSSDDAYIIFFAKDGRGPNDDGSVFEIYSIKSNGSSLTLKKNESSKIWGEKTYPYRISESMGRYYGDFQSPDGKKNLIVESG